MKRYDFRSTDQCDMCGSTRARPMGVRLSTSQGLRPRGARGIGVTVVRCECGLVYANPQPVPANILDHYGVPPDEYWATVPEWSPADYANEIATAKTLLDFTPGMTALDIGVGTGAMMRSLIEAGFETAGIEPSSEFRDHAMAKGLSDITLASIEDAEFPDESFDLVTFGAVLEHLYSPSAAIEKALKWLKPGGIIQADIPASNWLIGRLVNAFYRLQGTSFVTNISPMHSPYHLFEFSLDAFRRNGDRLGYDIALQRRIVCDPVHVPRPLKPLFRWIMEKTGTGMELEIYLRKRAPGATVGTAPTA